MLSVIASSFIRIKNAGDIKISYSGSMGITSGYFARHDPWPGVREGLY
ncbi:hypothetical protein [Methanooceanicella nereidis]|nr:hypothetical protein [Methanocella sp. CWC-04]